MSLLNGAWFDFVVGIYRDGSPTDLREAAMEQAFSPGEVRGSEDLGRLPQAGMKHAFGAVGFRELPIRIDWSNRNVPVVINGGMLGTRPSENERTGTPREGTRPTIRLAGALKFWRTTLRLARLLPLCCPYDVPAKNAFFAGG